MKQRRRGMFGCLMLAWWMLTTTVEAGGGEDPPFFCSFHEKHGLEAFRIRKEPSSPTGWMMVLYHNFKVFLTIPVSISRSHPDQYVVYGRVRDATHPYREIAFHGLIGSRPGASSAAEAYFLSHGTIDPGVLLRPTICRPMVNNHGALE